MRSACEENGATGQKGPEPDDLRLLQFLRWVVPLVFGFAALAGAAAALFSDPGLLAAGVILLTYGGLLLFARRRVGAGERVEAVWTICVGLLLAALLMSAVQPGWLAVLAVTPLISVAVALPYVRGGDLLRLIFLAWLTVVVMAILSRALPPLSRPPAWFVDAFTAGALAAATAVVLLLLWQFSTRLNETLARTRAAEERYALAERGVNDGLWDWDLRRDRVYYSSRWKEMLGWREDEVGEEPDEWFRRVHPQDRKRLLEEVREHLRGRREHLNVEYRIRHRDGSYRWMLTRGLAVRDGEGNPVRMAGSQTDITRRKQAEEKLLHEASHDALTGLPNRAFFMERLGEALRRPGDGDRVAVLFIDLDRFKMINDSLGHAMGDRLLVAAAERLKGCLRPQDTLARLGGDEFTVLLEGVSSEEAASVADRLLERLREPFRLDGYELFTAASVGVVLGGRERAGPEELLRDADIAMYRAKALGGGRKGIFEAGMHTRAMELFRLENELRRAIEREEFTAHYQPIVSLKTGLISGFEALVRWRHPERGLIRPDEFVPVAEETGLIVPLELSVVREACASLVSWQREFPQHRPLTMSVNLSRNQLARPELPEQVERILLETGLDARSLRLEVTESAIMENVGSAAATLSRLRDMNIRVHIDDFGMGYSSLSVLHQLPIDALKVDRSFVGRMDGANDDVEIVQTIITLAHNLGLDVVAEGVEREEHLDRLRRLGCDYAQGFLFSEPLDAAGARRLLSAYRRW
ncbi:diguanylate cyclase/phosphodiesterase with PAS/PAC sensor(s) [Rubrobacter xylanophilus DSM 9941]|uniref:Diguanylate cyclase/phosphodiesterase with PAS/PAC sensor(S) n=1 Tax=Rubrobacter xylanophilus (strain DSM 9941 / JCM 11954 / NBRC 16129 / PRD-1) TaxID=266117 RepID=Q1AYR2_RUBXD|nr:GGDEF domain-containing phosphodiesterase [Rubrobacter xylanophilus]ABG03466.1 diguanylate cyclase/phosphodiesterase with PAS/PAC sensor(s) [Rubrobacter xylanophilus DSM 9941]